MKRNLSFQDSLNLIQRISHQLCSQWLTWIQQATLVSADFREILAQRDLQMRKISAERDPGNAMITKIFGTELTNQLIQALWTPESTPPHAS